MKNSDLKQAYGKPPKEFHEAVLNAVNSLDSKQSTKSNKKLLKILIACAIVAVLGTTTVVASKIYSMVVSPEGNYGMNVEVSSTTGQKLLYPKLIVTNLPSGVQTQTAYSTTQKITI